MFAPARVVLSHGDEVLDEIPNEPVIVVATPGAEPQVADGWFGCGVIIDTWIPLTQQDLRADEAALRQWMPVAQRVAPRSAGGEVVIAAHPEEAVVVALTEWDSAGFARMELADRAAAGFPPVLGLAVIDAPAAVLESFLRVWQQPAGATTLGPVPLPAGIRPPGGLDQGQRDSVERLLIRIPREQAASLGQSLRKAQAEWGVMASVQGPSGLRIVVDPIRVG